jgi:hypothetical protein
MTIGSTLPSPISTEQKCGHGKDRAYREPESVMRGRTGLKSILRGLGSAAILAGAAYGGLVIYNRLKYGAVKPSPFEGKDSLLDRFIPEPEVVEHHQIAIGAPADVVMATAKEMQLLDSPIIRGIIRMREMAMGGQRDERQHPAGLLELMQSIGWVVLSEKAGREIALGCVTQPWQANPVFRPIPPDQYLAFGEPGYVKIAWTLRADPIDEHHSTFHTETRVCTTDSRARERFRTYWSFVAPGVEVIRVAMLRPLKRAAEARWHTMAA